MATGPATTVSDVIVPEIYDPYNQILTEEKTRIIRSGAAVIDESLSAKLDGGGLTFNTPAFNDLDNDVENIMTDNPDDVYSSPPYNPPLNNAIPAKITTLREVSVRLSRHKSWSSLKLAAALAGDDPQTAVANLTSGYWARRSQAVFIATWLGVIADNEALPVGTEHVQGDLSYDALAANGGNYAPGITDFNAPNFLSAALTMGDSQEDLGMVMMHSIVYHRAQLNNLIDFVQDSINGQVIGIPTFLGRQVIVDDDMPNDGTGGFDTWLFGAGSTRVGVGTFDMPSETERLPAAGGGGGQDVLHNRVSWCYHPVGHRFAVASPGEGGPSNEATAGNLAHEDSWQRVYPQRKQIKFARLFTKEF